ncbi:MAG: hypothetical protein KDA61_07890 [Planctomycetales bacterium]|nr:hypothetical protein [Planctomycetales bacterium]
MTNLRIPQLSAPLRDKLAQLMVVRIGSNLPPVRTVEQDADRVAALLEQTPVGGLIVFNGQADATPRTLERLQQACAYGLWVGADIERGVGQQLRGLPLYPHAMAFDALQADAGQTVAEFARETAATARAHGLHASFSPVADVNVDPRNPIIATRAFGVHPTRVAELAAAYVKGCRQGGLLTAAKHFPGHGNTHEDSHHELPQDLADLATIERVNLPPFAACVAAGVDMLMTAHVAYPAIDASGLPATLSRRTLVDLLRTKMGFEGAVISDSLLMQGVRQAFATEGELAVAALNAGVDLLLDVADAPQTLRDLEHAVERGELSVERVDEAFERLVRMKEQAFQQPGDSTTPVARAEALASRVAATACRVVKNAHALLPLDAQRPLTCLLFRPYESHLDPPEQPLAAALRERFKDVIYVEATPSLADAELPRLQNLALEAGQLCIAIVVKPAAWHRFGLPQGWQQLISNVAAEREFALACLGTPEGLLPYDCSVQICAFSDVPYSQIALANLLAGVALPHSALASDAPTPDNYHPS